MSQFEDMLADDMANVFLDSDVFAESVTYTPFGGSSRAIKAIVDRDPPAIEGQTLRPKMVLTVANNATTGILSSDLDTGGDTITIAYRKGETATAYSIQRSPNEKGEDSAMLRIELH